MPGRSKIAVSGHAEQVESWLAEGKTMEWIASRLNEMATIAGRPESATFTYTDVKRYKAKMRSSIQRPEERAIKRWNREQDDALSIVQEAVDFALEQKPGEAWDRDVRETIAAKLAVAREKLKILGAYPREGVQVGVKIDNTINPQTGVDDELRRELKRLLTERDSTGPGGRPPESGNPDPTS